MGQYYNELYKVPLPVVLEISADDSITWKITGKPPRKGFLNTQDSLISVDTFSYRLKELTPGNLKLARRINDTTELDFVFARPISSKKERDSAELRNLLTAQTWIEAGKRNAGRFRVEERFRYDSDKELIHRIYRYGGDSIIDEWEARCFLMETLGSYQFISTGGEYQTCAMAGVPVRQIYQVGKNRFSTRHFTRDGLVTTRLTATASRNRMALAEPDSMFYLCNENTRWADYYSPAKFTGGKPGIVRYFQRHFQPIKNGEDQNGYVSIRFLINCEGKTGRFDLAETDLDYQPRNFDRELIRQLLRLVKDLKGWEPSSRNGLSYDTFTFLSFRIEAGRLVEVVP